MSDTFAALIDIIIWYFFLSLLIQWITLVYLHELHWITWVTLIDNNSQKHTQGQEMEIQNETQSLPQLEIQILIKGYMQVEDEKGYYVFSTLTLS